MSVPVLSSSSSGFSQLNIQGVHASNISATPVISTYPASTTSTSLGHYHFVDPTTKSSNHLNVSASSTGGHLFSHASATQTPKTILTVNRDGLFTDSKLEIETAIYGKAKFDSVDLRYTKDLYESRANSEAIQLIYNGALNTQINNSGENPNIYFSSPNFEANVSSTEFKITGTECKSKQQSSGFYVDDVDKTNRFLAVTNQVELSSELTANKIILTNNPLTPSIKVKDNSLNESDLTPSDLTFNGVSIFSSITATAQKQIVSQIQPVSSVIYADSSIAPQTSPFLNTYGYGGWAYKKASPQVANAKINWYFPFPIIGGTVGDLKGLYYQIFNNCTGVGDLPFFVVYTRPLGNPTDYAPWYHSSRVYTPATNSSANQTCQMYANIKSVSFTPNSIGMQNQINMVAGTTNGTYLDTDVILFIAFGTNSGSALNAVDFSCGKIGMITEDYSAEFLLL